MKKVNKKSCGDPTAFCVNQASRAHITKESSVKTDASLTTNAEPFIKHCRYLHRQWNKFI